MFRFLFGFILGAVAAVAALIAYPLLVQDDNTPLSRTPPASARDVRVIFGPEALTEILRESIAQSEAPLLLGVTAVELGNGVFTVRGTTPRDPPNVPLSLRLSPFVEDGRLRVQIDSASVGLLPVPAEASRLVERPLNERLRATTGDVPYTITSVQVRPAGLEFTVRVDVSRLQGRRATGAP
jgi:hypothetical protein